MAFNFLDWIFNRFPVEYKQSDTYKDDEGKGVFERYLSIFGYELDEIIVPEIEDYTVVYDILETPDKYLNHLAYALGNPPDYFNNVPKYRKFLSTIISIYQIKGTVKSFEYMFELLDFDVSLVLGFPTEVTYDTGVLYDSFESGGFDRLTYDNYCNNCVKFSILLVTDGADCTDPSSWELPEIDEDVRQLLQDVACFLAPINAQLEDLVPSMPICDELLLDIPEVIEVYSQAAILYDNSHDYDDSEIHDYTNTGVTTITYP